MFRRTLNQFSAGSRAVTPADVQSAFRVLGLNTKASSDDVRQQYLKLARTSHPDMNGGSDEKMKLINLAYETVQSHGTLLSETPASSSGGGGEKQAGQEPNVYKQGWQRRSPNFDHRAWNNKSEFDWSAAVGVTPEERLDSRNHPNTFNPFFSFDDDATLYQAVRSGSTMKEAAATLGKTEAGVEKRLNSAQFKLRIQRMVKLHGRGAQPDHKAVVNPRGRVTFRPRAANYNGDDEDGVTAAAKAAVPAYSHWTRFKKHDGSRSS